jgi:hypothetical protein
MKKIDRDLYVVNLFFLDHLENIEKLVHLADDLAASYEISNK